MPDSKRNRGFLAKRIALAATATILSFSESAAQSDASLRDLPQISRPIDYMALFRRFSPKFMTSPETSAKVLETVFCGEMSKAHDEFERRDIANNIVNTVQETSKKLSGRIIVQKIDYNLGNYDFGRQGFPINDMGRNGRRLNGLMSEQSMNCWPDQQPGFEKFRKLVVFSPGPQQIPSFISVPEAQAKDLVKGARPSIRFSFILNVKNVQSLIATDDITIQGDLSDVKANIIDGTGKSLKQIDVILEGSSGLPNPGPKAFEIQSQGQTVVKPANPNNDCAANLKRLNAESQEAMQIGMQAMAAKDDGRVCRQAPTTMKKAVEYQNALVQCKERVDGFEAEMKSISSAIDVTKLQISGCENSNRKQAETGPVKGPERIPNTQWIKIYDDNNKLNSIIQPLIAGSSGGKSFASRLMIVCLKTKKFGVAFTLTGRLPKNALYIPPDGDVIPGEQTVEAGQNGQKFMFFPRDKDGHAFVKSLITLEREAKRNSPPGTSVDFPVTDDVLRGGQSIMVNGIDEVTKTNFPACRS